MKKMYPFLTILSVTLLLALSACASNSNGLTGTNWKLISYGPASTQTPAAPGVETNLTFGADGKLSGHLGCNSMGGDYSTSGQNITLGAVFSTEMACPDPQMTQEGIAFQVLKSNDTVGFKLDGNTLTITSSDGKNALIFTAITGK